jgi:hypothetical protein
VQRQDEQSKNQYLQAPGPGAAQGKPTRSGTRIHQRAAKMEPVKTVWRSQNCGKNQEEEATLQLINSQRNLSHREEWPDRQIFERSIMFLTITVEPQNCVVTLTKKIQNKTSKIRLDRFKADSVTMLA